MTSRISGSSRSGTIRPERGNWSTVQRQRRFAQWSDLHNARSLWQCIRGWRQDRAAIVATRECALQSEAMLGLIVRNALVPIELGQSSFYFGQKDEPFNGIVDGGIRRHRLESLDNAVAGKWLRHGTIVNTFGGKL